MNLRKPVYKPGFVSARRIARRRSFLWADDCSPARAADPGVGNGPDRSCSPIWPCSGWGLPSQPVARLLVGSYIKRPRPPHRFTLTEPTPEDADPAVYFLLHFPYPRRRVTAALGRWTLSTTLSYGARTFLQRTETRQRPSNRLAKNIHCTRLKRRSCLARE